MIFGFRFLNETKKSCFGRAKILFGVARIPSFQDARDKAIEADKANKVRST